MLNVTEQDLDAIATASQQTELAFFGVAVGTLIVLGSIVLIVPLSPRLYATFVALAVVSLGFIVFFGLVAIRHFRENARRLERIKRR